MEGEAEKQKGGVQTETVAEKPFVEGFRSWRIIEESEMSEDQSERVKEMGNTIYNLAKDHAPTERNKILEGTGLTLEVAKDYTYEDGKVVELENPDDRVDLEGKGGWRLSRTKWDTRDEVSIDLMFPDSGPVATIVGPCRRKSSRGR